MKAAARRRIDGIGDLSLWKSLWSPSSGIWNRNCVQQGSCVWMFWIGKNSVHGAGLDDSTEIHDCNAVADELCGSQIVGDENIGKVKLALEIEQQFQNLRSDRHVQHCHGLVCNDKLRSEEHTSELQSLTNLVCRLLLEK